jgi:hypothetical protein
MAFTNCTITGTFHDANENPLNGTFEATPSGVMQNSGVTTSPKVVKAKITAGVLSVKLVANDDPGTLPNVGPSSLDGGIVFYTIKIQLGGAVLEEFTVFVRHEKAEWDITELREKAGRVGIAPSTRQPLTTRATNQEIVELLGNLGLCEVIQVQPLSGELP